jgi:HK97 family phage prohead protease
MERRYAMQPVRVELRNDGGQKQIRGTASVFYDGTPDTEYLLYDDLKERIMPGAFDRALTERHDVRALFNHDPNQVLGRTPNTLRLAVGLKGLEYEADMPDTQAGRDVAHLIERGDVTGSSFGFIVRGQRFISDGKMDIREITDVDLLDVSPVTYPAYTSTSVGMRAAGEADDAKAARAEWKAGIESKLKAYGERTAKVCKSLD